MSIYRFGQTFVVPTCPSMSCCSEIAMGGVASLRALG
jgi:hypothetical protein